MSFNGAESSEGRQVQLKCQRQKMPLAYRICDKLVVIRSFLAEIECLML